MQEEQTNLMKNTHFLSKTIPYDPKMKLQIVLMHKRKA